MRCPIAKATFIRQLLLGPSLLLWAVASKSIWAQEDDDFIYCHRDEGQLREGERVFFTDVFRGDYGWTVGYENDFLGHIESQGVDIGAYSGSFCFFEPTRTAAEGARSRDMDEYRSGGYTVVRTGWAPDGSLGAAAGSESFTPQPLRDFRISIPTSPYDVEVCVRDHECEDGDRVRVSVNGIELMSGRDRQRLDVPERGAARRVVMTLSCSPSTAPATREKIATTQTRIRARFG